MTASVSSIGKEIIAAKPGQQTPRGAPWADGARGASGLDSAGSRSSAPAVQGFRSSWQRLVDPLLEVSRGTNSINNLEDKTSKNAGINQNESVLNPNKLEVASFASFAKSLTSAPLRTQSNISVQASVAQAEAPPLVNKSRPKAGADTSVRVSVAPGIASNAPESCCTGGRNVRNLRHSPAHKDSAELRAISNQHGQYPVPAVSGWASASPMSPGPATTSPAPVSATSGLPTPPQTVPQQLEAVSGDRPTAHARNTPGEPAALSHDATLDSAAGEASETSDGPVNLRKISPPAEEPQAPKMGRESTMTALRATGDSPVGESSSTAETRKLASSGVFRSGEASASPHADRSSAERSSAGSSFDISTEPREHTRDHATMHEVRHELSTIATAAVATQPITSETTDTSLRTSPTFHATSPGISHAQATSAPSPASAPDTFAALDGETSLGAPTWTHAGGQHAEAGFRDPDLGWVGVRADLNASGVHATLVPSSADAAQALSGHVAGLTSHLAEQHAPVATLGMASPDGNAAGDGTSQHMQQGTDGNAPGNQPGGSAPPRHDSTVDSSTRASSIDPERGVSSDVRTFGESRGRHISVIA